ncbi:hypothetical protein L1987_87792 [Smallanthus sonchifolius]|nr:hypothetical protein L1987_87792 [Smallanthus sonchifolius]
MMYKAQPHAPRDFASEDWHRRAGEGRRCEIRTPLKEDLREQVLGMAKVEEEAKERVSILVPGVSGNGWRYHRFRI